MKITNELVVSSTSQKKQKGEEDEHFMNRITHLSLNNKNITKIVIIIIVITVQEGLESCPNLEALYLYDNQITEIDNLVFKKLTNLYLQNNLLTSTKGLGTLYNLTKLYVKPYMAYLQILEWKSHLEGGRFGKTKEA